MPQAKKDKQQAAARKSFKCAACNRRVRIPDGWPVGPAVRRHYWAKHRERQIAGGKR